MIRKFLLACMVLSAFTIQTQAISINELNSSPQFKNVYQKPIPIKVLHPKDRLIKLFKHLLCRSTRIRQRHIIN